MPKIIDRPTLVNRGGAGLLSKGKKKLTNRGPAGLVKKLEEHANSVHRYEVPAGVKNNIPAQFKDLTVAISKLVLDPDNARIHNERNMQAIRDSLNLYGQCKPIVVRKQNMVIVAGNGTAEAAKQLGWTKIAALVVPMTDAEAAGYGIADNRTAELAKWNIEIVKRLERLCHEAGHPSAIGWSDDEVEVMRAATYEPPALADYEGPDKEKKKLLISFTPDQHLVIEKGMDLARTILENAEADQAECVTYIVGAWLERLSELSNGETDEG